MHEAWYNWGTDLGDLAGFVAGSDSSRAEEVYREAFEKYERAVDIKPDMYEAWHNWGNALVKYYFLLETEQKESSRFISEALSKLYRSIEIQDENPDTHFSIVVALAERGEDGDIDAAANHLRTYLDADPQHIYVIEGSEYADIIRAHSKLRDILDAYKAKADVDEEDLEDADRPDEPGQADLDLLSE